MKNNKGFTLIELLAVIVILAIIALIAVPIVLKIVENSRESANERSAELYVDAVEKNIVAKQMKLSSNKLSDGIYNINKNGDVCLNNSCSELIKVSIKGTKPTDGYVTIQSGKIISYGLLLNGKNYSNTSPEEWFIFSESTKTITGLSSDWDGTTDIIIPSTIKGTKVTTIGNTAFVGKGLTSVVLPNTVTLIDYAAFSGNQITNLILPNSVLTINYAAFSGNQITNLIIPDNVIFLGNTAFAGNQITSITIPSSVMNLENNVFNSSNLIKVTINGKTNSSGFTTYGILDNGIFKSPFVWKSGSLCATHTGGDNTNPCISWEG